MGISASQARLLYLTRRIVDVEFQAQQIMSMKIDISTKENVVYQKYLDALDATTLTYRTANGENLQANFTNLCGLNSISNSLASNKKFVFRSSDDELIVPSDVYDGYEEYGGDDPYEFAMFMMGVNVSDEEGKNNFDKAEEKFLSQNLDKDNTYLKGIKDTISSVIDRLYTTTDAHKYDYTGKGEEEHKKDLLYDAIRGDFSAFENENTSAEDKSALKTLKEKCEEYRHKIYNKNAAAIYEEATGADSESFDKSKFDYYLYWGKLIQSEDAYVSNDGSLQGCARAGDYQDGFENNADTLNNMLLYGKISIESVEVNNSTGKVADPKFTTVSSETALAFTSKDQVDPTERRKAEAEYNKALQEIQREEKMYDMKLANLETERQELTAQVETVKTVIKEAIDRSFKIFS